MVQAGSFDSRMLWPKDENVEVRINDERIKIF